MNDQPTTQPDSPRRKRRRRWWQILARWAVLLLVVLTGAYVSLPWWLPTAWLRDQIADALAADLGAEVRIGRLSVSWSDGVQLQDLEIGSPPGFSDRPMVTVGSLRMDFAPLAMLLDRDPDWMEVDRPELSVEISPAGEINVLTFKNLLDWPQAQRVTVHHAAAVFRLPDQARDLRFEVSSLQFEAGRLQRLGRLTVAASFEQADDNAQVTLLVEGPQPGEQAAASVAFAFDPIDLEPLNLPSLLDLNLDKLAGRCSATVNLSVNDDALVDQFQLSITAEDLDIQPTNGPTIPLIEEAHLRIEATYDPLDAAGRLEIHSMTVRLPDALELTGSAVVYTDAITGNWQALRSLHLDGQVVPYHLAAMLSGSPQVPGTSLVVEGPVGLGMHLTYDGPLVGLDVTADATDAVIRQDGHTLKPWARPLTLALAGELDSRSWTFRADNLQATLGENELSGHGAIRQIRRWSAADDDATDVESVGVLARLADVDWTADWRIRDIESLQELLPTAAAWLAEAELEGELTGRAVIDGDTGGVELALTAPDQTHLALGSAVLKPRGKTTSFRASAMIDAEADALTDIDLDVTAGAGRLWIEGGHLALADDQSMTATGSIEISYIQSLLACLPIAGELVGEVRGGLRGRGAISAGPDATTLQIDLLDVDLHWPTSDDPDVPKPQMDVTGRAKIGSRISDLADAVRINVNIDAGDINWRVEDHEEPIKSAGQPLLLTLLANVPTADDQVTEIEQAVVILGNSSIALTDGSLAADGQMNVTFEASVSLSAPVFRLWPELLASLDKAGVAGRLSANGQFTRTAEAMFVVADVDATDASFEPLPQWAKPRGLVATARIQAEVPADGSSVSVSVHGGQFGPLEITGRAEIDAESFSVEGSLSARGPADELSALLPALGDLDASGAVNVAARWLWDRGELAVAATIQADRLTVSPAGRPIVLDGEAGVSLVLSPDQQRLDLTEIRADGLRFEIGPSSGWLVANLTGPTLTFDDLQALATGLSGAPLPALAFAGEVHVIGELIDSIQIAQWLSGGERVDASGPPRRLQGQVDTSAEILSLSAADVTLRMDGALTSGLVPGASVAISGVTLTVLDVSADTFRAGLSPTTPTAAGLAHLRVGDQASVLGDNEQAALLARAHQAIARVRPVVLASNVTVRASIDHLRTYRRLIEKMLDLTNMQLALSIEQGQMALSYAAGLNGGTLRRAFTVDWSADEPEMHVQIDISNVQAEDNIKPLVSWRFPGNTVDGLFNHSEDQVAPLAGVLANAMHPRYPLHPVGTGMTITTDGVAEGQAAPEFITNIFPGLNTTQYAYRKMTSFATYNADGSIDNDTIFDGVTYDTYMTGITDANEIAAYEIGVILLSPAQSPEWNHTYRQGRIPIMDFTGRIEDGRIYDVQVTYKWPTETMFVIFLENNYFYRIWLEVNRQKEETPDGDEQP